jgi:type II secretory pathway pseudopilin PulG
MRRSISLSSSARAFVLIENLVAATIIAVFAASALLALAQANRFATATRLRTLALATAQQRIDEVLTTPWNFSAPRPTVLSVGTRTETNLPLNDDTLASSGAGTLTTFSSLDGRINATRTTVVADVATRLLRANVTVNYTYRNRIYTVSLSTLRATDSI